jgi:hypothetical protein
MVRNAGFAAALAIVHLVVAGPAQAPAQAYDDKVLQPPAGPHGSLKDEGGGGYGGGYMEGYPPPQRPPGIQVFVGTPYAYNGYRRYYGPYMYGSPTRSGTNLYAGPDHGDGGACRRWAWVHLEPGKWLWGIIDSPNGEWRCAEW